jgi:hypothetical protein
LIILSSHFLTSLLQKIVVSKQESNPVGIPRNSNRALKRAPLALFVEPNLAIVCVTWLLLQQRRVSGPLQPISFFLSTQPITHPLTHQHTITPSYGHQRHSLEHLPAGAPQHPPLSVWTLLLPRGFRAKVLHRGAPQGDYGHR